MAKEIPVERIRYTTATVNEVSLHLGQMVGMERKFDLAVHWQELPEEIPRRHLAVPLEQVTAAQLYPNLHDTGLLPHNVIIYDWKALDATRNGLNTIGQVSTFWIQIQNNDIKSFSLGFAREGKGGDTWCCTIYTNNESYFLDHLLHHVNLASAGRCVSFFVTFQTKFVETMHELDWAQFNEGDGAFALTLLERVL